VIPGVLSRTALGVVVLLGASACSGEEPDARPSPAATTSTDQPTDRATPEPADTPTPTTDAPSPGSLDKPAETSGSLSQRSFPAPRRLGDGWRYAVDPGNAEEGYAGNGTPALARDPQEVLQTAVPFGCDRPYELQPPRHALEVDYTVRGAKAIAVRGKFADPASASAFFGDRARTLAGCRGRSGSPAIGPLVTVVDRLSATAVLSDRTPRSDPWSELAVLDRDTVVLLAVRGRDALSPTQSRRLVEAFRR
jgi:hypothetical protein